MASNLTFYEVLTQAIDDVARYGFDSRERVARWQERLRAAAEATLLPLHAIEQMLRGSMDAIYRTLVERGKIVELHPGLPRFTLERVRPQLRAELDRRRMAASDLIVLNRAQAVSTMERRFAGWASSVPVGGTKALDRREEKAAVKKSLASLPFEERRVIIDQGHKFRAALSEVVATGGGAIACVWHSHWRETNYNYRKDHKERDGLVYMLRGNWAQQKGLAKVGPDGYYDDITKAGEEVYCRCFVKWIYTLGRLPDEMLTKKGREALKSANAEIDRLRA